MTLLPEANKFLLKVNGICSKYLISDTGGMIWKDPLEIIGVQDSKVQPRNKVGRNTTVPSHMILDWACSGHYVILPFAVFVS